MYETFLIISNDKLETTLNLQCILKQLKNDKSFLLFDNSSNNIDYTIENSCGELTYFEMKSDGNLYVSFRLWSETIQGKNVCDAIYKMWQDIDVSRKINAILDGNDTLLHFTIETKIK